MMKQAIRQERNLRVVHDFSRSLKPYPTSQQTLTYNIAIETLSNRSTMKAIYIILNFLVVTVRRIQRNRINSNTIFI
jgi:hypothetical protein